MRYALYFTPPADDPLTGAAARWLGRDAFTGKALAPDGQRPDGWESLVAEPARYGFHATLKAPFHLAGGQTETDLLSALDVFAAETPAFTMPRLKIGLLGSFFALVPDGDADALDRFAADVVRAFEPFRAPLSAADIARRKPETLPEPERTYLHDWGYPYVFDAFRFHMTLTGPVPAERQDEVAAPSGYTFFIADRRPAAGAWPCAVHRARARRAVQSSHPCGAQCRPPKDGLT